MKIDNLFYVGEHGFFFNMRTGIDLTNAQEVRAAWLRPNGTTLSPAPTIPIGDVQDVLTGDINVVAPQGLLNTPGTYILQVVVRIAGGVIASRHIEFAVRSGAAPDLSAIFPA